MLSTIKTFSFFQTLRSKDLSVALLITFVFSLFSFQGTIAFPPARPAENGLYVALRAPCNRFFQPLLQSDLKIQLSVRSSNPAAICLVGPSGLEPPTLRLSVVRSSQLSYGPLYGGDSRDRTGDLLLARQALSQLS